MHKPLFTLAFVWSYQSVTLHWEQQRQEYLAARLTDFNDKSRPPILDWFGLWSSRECFQMDEKFTEIRKKFILHFSIDVSLRIDIYALTTEPSDMLTWLFCGTSEFWPEWWPHHKITTYAKSHQKARLTFTCQSNRNIVRKNVNEAMIICSSSHCPCMTYTKKDDEEHPSPPSHSRDSHILIYNTSCYAHQGVHYPTVFPIPTSIILSSLINDVTCLFGGPSAFHF